MIDQIGRFRERTGVDNLLCLMSVRAMEPRKVLRSMELFAAEVMPKFSETQGPTPEVVMRGAG